MNIDRPFHDETLLAELKALDELLRQPVEPAPPPPPPPPAPRDFTPVEREDFPRPSQNRATGLRDRAVDRINAWRERALASREDAVPLRDRIGAWRERAVASRERALASRQRAAASRAVTMRAAAAPVRVSSPPVAAAPSSRRIRVGALWGGALSVGLLIGALFGSWNAVKPVVDTPQAETATRARPAAAPLTKARPTSRSARPAALPRTATRTTSAPPSVAEPGIAPPPAAAFGDASTIVASIPSAPAPSIEPSAAPLTAAPLPIAPSPPLAAPPTAVAAAGGLAAAMVAADEAAITSTLRRYEEAYEHLDAKAASAIWPTVDQRALSHAFAGLASQRLNFRGCEVIVRAFASMATASCSGTAEYVRKVGDTRPRVEPRQWSFTLNKTQGAWRIESVDGSR